MSKGVQYYFVMGRQIFVIEENLLLIFFYYAPDYYILFLISSTSAPKNKSKHGALFSECVVLMRGCSGAGEYEAGKEKITVYSLQKTRLHH